MANEQLPTSSTPTLASEPSSAVQTESESNDGSSSDGSDDDKPIEQSSSDSVQTADESEQQSATSDDDDKDDASVCKEQTNENEMTNSTDLMIDELVSNVAAAATAAQNTNDDKVSAIDLDAIRYKNLKIFYEGRDILDFSTNVANKSWSVKYAHLPEQNYQMYIQNRSQYNRLAPGYESPENYSLNACGRCAFQFPVMVDIPDENDAAAAAACKSSVNDLLTQTVGSIVSSLAQKLPAAQPMAQPPMHTPTGHSMNNNLNNFMLNNNAASPAQSYAYQNRNQFAGNANAVAAAAAAAAAAANNHNSFKPNNNNNNNNSNAFYGNNMVLNALVNQIGNNMNNSSVFNSNFMNAINNGTNNNTAVANTNNTTVNPLNQLSNAALANLMNQQNQRQQLYGMCRQNINKSGINFNANSHKQMPTYSHF